MMYIYPKQMAEVYVAATDLMFEKKGPVSLYQVWKRVNLTETRTFYALQELGAKGLITREENGRYSPAKEEEPSPEALKMIAMIYGDE